MNMSKNDFISNDLFHNNYKVVLDLIKHNLLLNHNYIISHDYISEIYQRVWESRFDYTAVVFLRVDSSKQFLLLHVEFGTHQKVFNAETFGLNPPKIFKLICFKFPEFTNSGQDMVFEDLDDEDVKKNFICLKTISSAKLFDYALSNPENIVFYCEAEDKLTLSKGNYFVGVTMEECTGYNHLGFMLKESDIVENSK